MSLRSYAEVYQPRFLLEANGGLAADIIPFVTKFEFEDDDTKQFDKLTLQVANPGLRFKDDRRFKEGARFRCRFGYLNDISDVKSMVIAHARPHFGSGMPTIDMVAFSAQQDMNKKANPTNWGAISSSTVAKFIAVVYDLKTDIEESNDARRQARVQPASVTDIQYLMSLAHPLNWDCYVEGDTLHFHKKRYDSRAVIDFVYYTDNTGSLLKFEPDVNMTAPPAVSKTGTDTKTGESESKSRPAGPRDFVNTDTKRVQQWLAGGDLSPASTRDPSLQIVLRGGTPRLARIAVRGGTPSLVLVGTDEDRRAPPFKGEGGLSLASHETDPRVIAKHGEALATAIDMNAVKATAEAIGTPQVRARTMIRISGVDQQYSGSWRVSKSKHVIDAKSVYQVHMNLKRDAGAAKGKTDKEKKAEAKAKGAEREAIQTDRKQQYGSFSREAGPQ